MAEHVLAGIAEESVSVRCCRGAERVAPADGMPQKIPAGIAIKHVDRVRSCSEDVISSRGEIEKVLGCIAEEKVGPTGTSEEIVVGADLMVKETAARDRTS